MFLLTGLFERTTSSNPSQIFELSFFFLLFFYSGGGDGGGEGIQILKGASGLELFISFVTNPRNLKFELRFL